MQGVQELPSSKFPESLLKSQDELSVLQIVGGKSIQVGLRYANHGGTYEEVTRVERLKVIRVTREEKVSCVLVVFFRPVTLTPRLALSFWLQYSSTG
ncbi:hypothetical protein J6590_032331 [Homalodisca vitripennis]|nr:hypothetical protein J6590_032331 [Homalodisca vitripennis]